MRLCAGFAASIFIRNTVFFSIYFPKYMIFMLTVSKLKKLKF